MNQKSHLLKEIIIGQISTNFNEEAFLNLKLNNLTDNEKKYLDLIYDLHKKEIKINCFNIWKNSDIEMLVIYMQCVNSFDKSIL